MGALSHSVVLTKEVRKHENNPIYLKFSGRSPLPQALSARHEALYLELKLRT